MSEKEHSDRLLTAKLAIADKLLNTRVVSMTCGKSFVMAVELLHGLIPDEMAISANLEVAQRNRLSKELAFGIVEFQRLTVVDRSKLLNCGYDYLEIRERRQQAIQMYCRLDAKKPFGGGELTDLKQACCTLKVYKELVPVVQGLAEYLWQMPQTNQNDTVDYQRCAAQFLAGLAADIFRASGDVRNDAFYKVWGLIENDSLLPGDLREKARTAAFEMSSPLEFLYKR